MLSGPAAIRASTLSLYLHISFSSPGPGAGRRWLWIEEDLTWPFAWILFLWTNLRNAEALHTWPEEPSSRVKGECDRWYLPNLFASGCWMLDQLEFTAPFRRFSRWDLCIFRRWDLQVLIAFSLVLLLRTFCFVWTYRSWNL